MAKGFKKGAGGANSLNFKVVGGTTAPANPKENTIWVNTDTAISSWAFSATQPETPVEGMVWIMTDTAGTVSINTLKKNALNVYPVAAKQYVGGTWVDKTAKSYQGGEWVDWKNFLYIFKEGVGASIPLTSVRHASATSESKITIGTNNISMSTGGSSSYTEQAVRTTDAVDLSEFTTLFMDIETNIAAVVGVGKTAFNSTSGANMVASITAKSGSRQIVSLDVSNLTGGYYAGITISYGANKSTKIFNWWLE